MDSSGYRVFLKPDRSDDTVVAQVTIPVSEADAREYGGLLGKRLVLQLIDPEEE